MPVLRGLDGLFRRPRDRARHRALPFGGWVDDFVEARRAEGYSEHTLRNHMTWLGGLGRELARRGLGPEAVADPKVLEGHVARWRRRFRRRHGRGPKASSERALRQAVGCLVGWAREAGHLPSGPRERWPVRVEEYLAFCREHQGLAEGTVAGRGRVLGELAGFLGERGWACGGGVPLELLDGFVARLGRRLGRTSLHSAVGAVRGFLGWLFLVGEEPEDRSRWLEPPRTYREMRLPRYLTEAQLQEAPGRIDRATATGRRDWAVWMLLSVYGLRPGEVAALRLGDLDFEARRLRVRRLEGGPEQVLPMLEAVEEALRDYLERGRPRPERGPEEVILTHRAPLRGFASGGRLATACVSRYLEGVEGVPERGGYVLRHTAARRLRQAGAPVTVIRRLPGHRSSDSTGRYLRIATEELREVAANYAELL